MRPQTRALQTGEARGETGDLLFELANPVFGGADTGSWLSSSETRTRGRRTRANGAQDEDRVFVGRRGGLENNFNRYWEAARERAGLPWLRVHDLRHEAASRYLEAGGTLRELMELGGWFELEAGRAVLEGWQGPHSRDSRAGRSPEPAKCRKNRGRVHVECTDKRPEVCRFELTS